MKKIIQGLLLLLLLTSPTSSFAEEIKMTGLVAKPVGVLPKTGQITSYTGYDDGYYQAGNPASPRYVDNRNGTITDNTTGLMWVKDPSLCDVVNPYPNAWALSAGVPKPTTWANAITNCEALDYAGYTDWRLPNIKELSSIIDFSKINPAIDPMFINSFTLYYWSSTTFANSANEAYVGGFSDGMMNTGIKTNASTFYVRPVRGGRYS